MCAYLQKDDSSTKKNISTIESKTVTSAEPISAQINVSSTILDEGTPTNIDSQCPNAQSVPPTTSHYEVSAVNVDEQHSYNAQYPNWQSISVPFTEVGTKPDSHQLKESVSSKGSDMGIVNSPAHFSVSQEKTKQGHQEAQYNDKDKVDLKKHHYLITHNKENFQQYLIEKGLNYQSKTKQVEMCDLQFCLSMYTDLDVLDENNKFLCQACQAQKQRKFVGRL